MTRERFHTTLLDGHKGAALEIPFDPSERGFMAPKPVKPGRRGHRVSVQIGDVVFESVVVARAGKFWVLVPDDAMHRAKVAVGDRVRGSVAPLASPEPAVSAAKAAQLIERARTACLALEGAYEQTAHGEPTFRVRDRVFVMVANDHHGDGRIALWCNAPVDAQHDCVAADPENYFVPPYVGKRGWIGVRLDRSLSRAAIAAVIEQAYRETLGTRAPIATRARAPRASR